jgi:hypothetical protein
VGEPGADERRALTVAHERRVGRHPVRTEGREVGDRFGQVRLTLAVAADQQIHARPQLELGLGVVAEVDEAEVLDDHRDYRSSRLG